MKPEKQEGSFVARVFFLGLIPRQHVERSGQRLPSHSAHANLYAPAQELLAPSTNEDLRNAGTGQNAPFGVPSSQRGLGSLQRKVGLYV